MKFLLPVLFYITLILSTACQRPNQGSVNTREIVIPELLQRGKAIQNGKEWDDVQSAYQKHSLSFRKNPNEVYAGLALVEIFTQEARVTGEHGHYYPAALQLVDQVLSTPSLKADMKFYALTLQSLVNTIKPLPQLMR